jgi:hypothetical protein
LVVGFGPTELLSRRWSRAKTGEGQVVLLSGEAGIGKSRLTAALLERLAGEPHTRLRYFCSPQHTDSALYPVIGQMERAAGFVHDDTPQAKLDKVDAVLARTSASIKDAALFAEMPGAPLRALRDAGTTNFYWQYFQTPGMAEVAFERDVEHTVRTLLYGKGVSLMMKPGQGFLADTTIPEQLPTWLSDQDLRTSLKLKRSGYRGGLNWYRNIDRNWELSAAWEGMKIAIAAEEIKMTNLSSLN